MKPVLILETGNPPEAIAREYGNFDNWIIDGARLTGHQYLTVPVHQGGSLPDPANIGSVIVTGSPAMVTEDLPWIHQSEIFLRQAIDLSVPVLGICFGHQLLGQALGGKAGWNPRGREIGTTHISLHEMAATDPLFESMPTIFPAHVTHMQSVLEVPEGAVVLGGNDFDGHQVVRFSPTAWGVQFHPEFDEQIMRGYIRERSDQLIKEGLNPQTLSERVESTIDSLSLLERFVGL